jgi:hypothetical protein
MDSVPEAAQQRGNARHMIEVADESLNYRKLDVDDPTPSGAQLAAAAGFRPADEVTVLNVLVNGELEDVRPTETVDLRHATARFIIVETDRSYRLTIDGERYDWVSRIVSGAVLRKLGTVPADEEIYLERADQPDRLIGGHDLVDLNGKGVESFKTRKPVWKLNVQGVILELHEPTIVVKDAMQQAGFDPAQGWLIYLKVKDEPKKAMALTDVIDLRKPGIEKLRLTPNEVNNGEAAPAARRAFALLDVDEAHLNRIGLRWETVIDAGRRWLLIHNYPVPGGYTVLHTLLALEIPPPYPGAQIDMFYTYPTLQLATGQLIDRTQVAATIEGLAFNGWSRHRGPGSPWNSATDNVVTHLALVESALWKEVGA